MEWFILAMLGFVAMILVLARVAYLYGTAKVMADMAATANEVKDAQLEAAAKPKRAPADIARSMRAGNL